MLAGWLATKILRATTTVEIAHEATDRLSHHTCTSTSLCRLGDRQIRNKKAAKRSSPRAELSCPPKGGWGREESKPRKGKTLPSLAIKLSGRPHVLGNTLERVNKTKPRLQGGAWSWTERSQEIWPPFFLAQPYLPYSAHGKLNLRQHTYLCTYPDTNALNLQETKPNTCVPKLSIRGHRQYRVGYSITSCPRFPHPCDGKQATPTFRSMIGTVSILSPSHTGHSSSALHCTALHYPVRSCGSVRGDRARFGCQKVGHDVMRSPSCFFKLQGPCLFLQLIRQKAVSLVDSQCRSAPPL